MTPRLIDLPRRFTPDQYRRAIERMVRSLEKIEGVISVYQVGSISAPGISDIDLLVVFREGSTYQADVRKSLSPDNRYLFAHDLYGLSEAHKSGVRRFCFFYEFTHLWGQDILATQVEDPPGASRDELQVQVALEYLAKMYIIQYIERILDVVKVRGLLLQAKALMKDLKYLGVDSGKIVELLMMVMEWRSGWFDHEIDRPKLCSWIHEFRLEYDRFVKEMFKVRQLFLSGGKRRIARNITVRSGVAFVAEHHGWILPRLFNGHGMYIKMQHRVNSFEFQFPAWISDIPSEILEADRFYRDMREVHKARFPHFMALTTSL